MSFLRVRPFVRPFTRHLASFRVPQRPRYTRYVATGVAAVSLALYVTYAPNRIHLDSTQEQHYGEGEVCMS